ncbi:hypothetical protein PVAND_016301 [Polypedilum vanderplanki]|uniref:Uncharacterized protein n=1 Tax=Polypedilum vanderplanki TaxID=319348 RepID=A0A9J6BFG0_POLVA|nr:hypothetical protein PVAND_016301 [Polypedilum vanderplanki]
MSEVKEILEKAKEKLIDAKDATKEKLGEIKHKLVKSDHKYPEERHSEVFDEGKDFSADRMEGTFGSDNTQYQYFTADKVDENVLSKNYIISRNHFITDSYKTVYQIEFLGAKLSIKKQN